MIGFSCKSCGSPSVKLPQEFHDDADVTCAGCGRVIADLATFRRQTEQAIAFDDGGRAPRPVARPSGREDEAPVITRRAIRYAWRVRPQGPEHRDPRTAKE